MENATKALIMAGVVLISIIVISIGIALWRQYSDFARSNEQRISNQQLREFNVQFSKYEYNENAQNYITAQDVRTIVNLAKDFNDKNGIDENDIIIDVRYGTNRLLDKKEDWWVQFLSDGNIR